MKTEEDHGSSLPQNDIRTIKAKAQRVIISGLSRTKDDLIGNRVQDVFKATNFEELVFHSLMVKEQLEKLGVFKKVVILMDTSKDPGADRNAYDVKFNVLEKRLLSGGIHTDVEPARMRSGLMGKLMFNNMFGRAETLSTEYHSDFKNRKEYYLTFRKPLKGDPDFSTSIGSYYTHTDFPPSGYNQTSAGLKTDFIIPSFGNIGSHTFQWDGVWRNLRALSRTTSFAVREEAGHSVKSSITKTAGTKYSLVEFILRTIGEDKHTFERDGRDDKILPNQGTYVKFMQEYAGLGGNTEFVKANAELQVNRTLLPDTVLQVSLAGGMMTKLDKEKSIAICDRFFLGGPLTLRGFDTNGIGAQSNGNFLGGDAYWLGAAHLYTPLPFRPGLGGFGQIFRSHFFINAGNQGNLSSDKSSKENMMDLLENYRLSCGAGIVLRLGGIARMELNYVYPIQYQRTDSVKSGLQFGLGISFF